MQSFPQEIKEYPQWAICGFNPGTSQEKQPYVWDNNQAQCVPLRKDGTLQNPSNLHMLMTFEDAFLCAQMHNKHGHHLYVGFYLLPQDPFCCIDMDMKSEWNSLQKQVAEERYRNIVSTFHSYTEVSKSGWGLHLWLYGKSDFGKRRDSVEIYSQFRFIICTGDHLQGTPLTISGKEGSEEEAYIAEWVEKLKSEMGDISGLEDFQMEELSQTAWENDPYKKTNFEIYTQGAEAVNGVVFKQLAEGRWASQQINHSLGERAYQSASEAEYAFIDMLCFYTKYNFQVREIFYNSPFGDRYFAERRSPGDKIKVSYHLEQMILKRRRDEARDLIEKNKIMQMNLRRMLEEEQRRKAITTPKPAPLDYLGTDGNYNLEQESELDWPPGFVGELSRHMMARSLRPIKEIAILSALSLLSGIVGKGWNTHTGGGLSNYFVLVAPSGIGKDAYRKNLVEIMNQVSQRGGPEGTQIFGANKVVSRKKFSSAQALWKNVVVQPMDADSKDGPNPLSFIHYVAEVGGFFKDISNGTGHAGQISNLMLDLYNESSFYATADSLEYSNKDNNHAGGRLAAYSFAGETTPTDFYSTITESMLANGFMSRLIIWECCSKRPLENKNSGIPMPDNMCQWLGDMFIHSSQLHMGAEPCTVQLMPEVEALYDDLDKTTTDLLNTKVNEEGHRQLYNRYGFKLLKLACVLAVADNHISPLVTMEHYQWAKSFMDLTVSKFRQKVETGEIGSGDDDKCVLAVIEKCLRLIRTACGNEQKKYPNLTANNILTKNDIRMNTIKNRVFERKNRDSSVAFDIALKTLCDNGALYFMTKTDLESEALTKGSRAYKGHCYLVDIDKMEELQDSLTSN